MERNFVAYQDEVFRLYPFVLRCNARQIPLLTKFAQNLKPEEFTEVRRSGLQQARLGMQQTLTGMLQELANPQIRLENKRAAAQAMAETADAFAAVLRSEARGQIVQLARAMQAGAPAELQPDIRKIAAAMSTSTCAGLCAL